MAALDPSSPVPLYHQIASALRERIRAGELERGHVLEPLREAALRLGVNVHTVRHAYAELAREGLVESRRARGTRVLASPGSEADGPAPPGSGGGAGLPEELARACRESGLGPRELHERLGRYLAGESAASPLVQVIECSRAQCVDLARQLEARFAVRARPWSLEEPGDPSEGLLVGTYFHYNEIRRRWPSRLGSVRFLTILPDPELAGLFEAFPAPAGSPLRVRVAETDEPTLQAVLADLSLLLPAPRFRLERLLVEDPAEALRGHGQGPVLFPPRLWSRLDEAGRADRRSVELRYVFDPEELDRLGETLGLRTRT